MVKKNGINKAVIITKNKVISINQLNYKAPERSHATKELVGYKEQEAHFCLSIQDTSQKITLISPRFLNCSQMCTHYRLDRYYCYQCRLLYFST